MHSPPQISESVEVRGVIAETSHFCNLKSPFSSVMILIIGNSLKLSLER